MRLFEGYIFLIVLIFMQIVSLLMFFEMRHARNFLELETLYQMQHSWHYQVAHLARQFDTYDWANSACVIMGDELNGVVSKPLNWWQERTCTVDQNNYFFIEKLDQYSCCKDPRFPNNQPFTVQFYRVTLAYFQREIRAELLQTSYAVLTSTQPDCKNNSLRFVVLGRQVMQEI